MGELHQGWGGATSGRYRGRGSDTTKTFACFLRYRLYQRIGEEAGEGRCGFALCIDMEGRFCL